MRTRRLGLGDVLFGRTRGAILATLFATPEESFYTREIVRKLNVSSGAIQRELQNLSNAGLIIRKTVGHQVFYQANRHASVFSEMRALVNKTVGVFAILAKALEPISDGIHIAFVYGSVAKNEATATSDVDLMVIGDASLERVLQSVSETEKSLGQPINPTVYSRDEFNSKVRAGNHFLKSVLNGPKLFLIGNDDELRKVGRVRLAKKRSK